MGLSHNSTITPEALADPSERPDADVLIYDGQCRFCRRQVHRLARWDRNAQLAFISLHDSRVAERYPDLTREDLMQDMYVVTRRGHRYAGADAFRYLSRHLRPLWIIAPLMHIPFSRPAWQWFYRQVARRRYLFRGQAEACDEGACETHFK